jgi:hypothetical protein
MTRRSQPLVYVLRYFSNTDPGSVWGIYSAEELAKSEGQKHHGRVPLTWKTLTTDNTRCQGIWWAKTTTWHTPCTFEVVAYRLDSRSRGS